MIKTAQRRVSSFYFQIKGCPKDLRVKFLLAVLQTAFLGFNVAYYRASLFDKVFLFVATYGTALIIATFLHSVALNRLLRIFFPQNLRKTPFMFYHGKKDDRILIAGTDKQRMNSYIN